MSLASKNDDVQLNILSFLDVDDVRTMMQVNYRYRRLLVSAESQELWKTFCRRQWSWLQTEHVQLVDDLHFPTAAVREGYVQPSFALLLSMAAVKSTRIDESLFERPHPSDELLRCPNCRGLTRSAKLRTIRTASGGHPAVQCCTEHQVPLGRMGKICIRADHPLPRPRILTQAPEHEDCPKAAALLEEEHVAWKPFVAPMVMPPAGSAQHQTPLQVHLTPRLVSYYEVSILDPPAVDVVTTYACTTTTAVPSLPLETETETDWFDRFDRFCGDDDRPCVAVGLTTDQFPLYSHMPGWDSNSFGYHGDDGGIYHDGSLPKRVYGPLFGAGDVVGCGIDYLASAIFFTLNGKFMGYALENLPLESLQQNYYPTVGLNNTNRAVQCNFGCDQPFVFDLTTIAAGQREAVFHTMLWNRHDGCELPRYKGKRKRVEDAFLNPDLTL